MIKHVQTQEACAPWAHSGEGAEDRFRAIVELAPDATVVADHDGRITLVNRQTEVLFGYERADLLGQPVELLMPARFHAAHQRHRVQYAMAPRTRPMGANQQLFGRRGDGGEFPVEVSLSLLYDDAGGFSVISTIRDVSERQRTEAARAAAELASEELRQIQAISDVALTHQSLDDLLGALLAGIRTVMAVDNVAILLTSEDGQAVTLHTAQGPEEEAVAGQLSVPIGRGVAGRIAATRSPLIVDDLSRVEVVNPLLRRLHALVGVPLLIGGRLIGVVHVASASPRHFTDEEAHLLQLVAERIAHALDHARMYDAEQAARGEAETALARAQVSESRFQRLMEANIIGILVGDTERAIEANDAFLRLLGYTRADLLAGRLRWATVTPPEYLAANERAVQQALTTGACEPFHKEYVRQDGSRVPVLVGFALLERNPAHFVTFVLDLSERERLEQEREAARASELVQLEVNRHMEQFLATAAHDLRSPVTGALFGVELAQRRVKRLAQSLASPHDGNRPTEQDEDNTACDNDLDEALAALDVLEHANQAVERLSRLISRLFDVSQAKTGKLEIRPMACDLADVVRGSVGAQRALTPGRTIRLDLPTGVEVPVIADADRIGQVVTNFLTNALKYSVPDRPVDIALEVNERRARVAVRDEGPGLPQEEQERVWEPFHRVPGIEVQGGASESLGLGLFICKTIVEHHGGTVGVESAEGKGSTFWFALPLASAIA